MKRSKLSRKMFIEGLESRSVLAGDCFHNFVLPEDADASGSITPLDALVVINRINQSRSANPSSPSSSGSGLVDVDADGSLTPLDALSVINQLNAQTSMGAAGPRASRVEVQRRIERIEQAIATNALPPNFTIDDAHAALDTLRSGGRPELGDHVVNGSLRWKSDDTSESDQSSESKPTVTDDSPEQVELKRLEHFIDGLSRRLKAFNVPSNVIDKISSEMVSAQQAGTPLDLMQIRTRLTELGVDVGSILPGPTNPGEANAGEPRPEIPERPELPERPEQPERPIMPAIMVTEPIAESILARLKIAGVTPQVVETVSKEIFDAIRAGTPLDLQQVRARLEELGVDWEKLHAPPTNTPPVVRPPVLGELDALQRVLPLLGRLGINRNVVLTIYTEAKAAEASGKPLTIDQIVARLKEFGVHLS
ncbi:MAG: dockerin type I domain-containing protein [Planctomycetota bacterium]